MTTSHIYNQRHDLLAQRKFQHDKSLTWSQNRSKKLNAKFSNHLIDVWQNLIIDETYFLKNLFSNIHIVMNWVNLKFTYLMTNISLFNNIKNVKVYIKLLQHKNVENWYNKAHLNFFQINENVNSYILFLKHLAVKLRYTYRAIKNFIVTDFIEAAIKNIYL